jgi:choline monooxygenase
MFVHKHQLAYLLSPQDYCSEEHRQAEVERMFLPAWHLGATKSELPHHGDRLSVDLFGHSVEIRNYDGQYLAHQILTPGEVGSAAAKIVLCRAEAWGDLIFVALREEAPPLHEFLDPFGDTISSYFQTPNWQLTDIWEYDCPSNWKVPAENTLESYHIPHVHQKTFGGIYPSEKATEHVLDLRYTMMEYDTGEDPRLDVWQTRIARWLGTEPTNLHVHRHLHPHTILMTSSLVSYIVNYLPISPRQTRVRLRMYSYRGTKSSLWARYIAWIFAIFSKRTIRRIMTEDLGIFADQQRGLETSRHKGVLGTREERIYVFQRWWMERMGREVDRSGEPLAPYPLANGSSKGPTSVWHEK